MYFDLLGIHRLRSKNEYKGNSKMAANLLCVTVMFGMYVFYLH